MTGNRGLMLVDRRVAGEGKGTLSSGTEGLNSYASHKGFRGQ